jgi:flagellar basal body rod protein FlgB
LNGNIRRFWVNDAEMIIWRNPALKPDKNTVLIDEELGAMMKINDEWYYHRMNVCRNK